MPRCNARPFATLSLLGAPLAGAAAFLLAAAPPAPVVAAGHICAAPPSSTQVSGYGTVRFANSCAAAVQPALQREIARMHSFEGDSASFAAIAKRDPRCAIAWWGAAMGARGNPLGGALDAQSFKAGRADVDRALAAARASSPRERDLIAALDVYYRPYPDTVARGRAYAERMDAVRAAYPDDPDIAALDGLAIIEGVDLDDKTFSRQKRAGAILNAVMAAHPEHPGAPHYLIHAYDYTALAPEAVHAAEAESRIAPASSHAQHMPSHIWTMLGDWNRSIDANRRSDDLADPRAKSDPVKADIGYDHAFDFIAYARLQKGEDRHVAEDLAAARAKDGMPTIIVARYALERDDWRDAMKISVPAGDAFDAALARFARAYGAARAGDAGQAVVELRALQALRKPVADGLGEYWGVFVDIYAKTARAWLLKDQNKPEDALALMRAAATQDDGHEKHIYLENKIIPAREALADMELALDHPRDALADYQESLKLAPNRYRSFLGAAQAAKAAGDAAGARDWSAKLLALARDGDHERPGWQIAQTMVGMGR